MNAHDIDSAIFDKIENLLNLAKDGGATEAEAAAAMEKAQAIMTENNLSMAIMEAEGHTLEIDGAKRVKSRKDGKALYKYQQNLMAVIARTNYCYMAIEQKWNGRRHMDSGYTLIGREANVASAFHQFDYLNTSLERILTPHIRSNSERVSRKGVSFKEGAASRLCERLMGRFDQRMRAQAEEAKAHLSDNMPLVILEDFAQIEADYNHDMHNGWKPGTTAQKRADAEKKAASFRKSEAARRAALTAAQRESEDRDREKARAAWARRAKRRAEAFWRNKDEDAYFLGYKEAGKVGLDGQIASR
jgi:hypothetical protein